MQVVNVTFDIGLHVGGVRAGAVRAYTDVFNQIFRDFPGW